MHSIENGDISSVCKNSKKIYKLSILNLALDAQGIRVEKIFRLSVYFDIHRAVNSKLIPLLN